MLRAIYKCGSQCILPKSHDRDILKVYDTKEEVYEARKIGDIDDDIDYHYQEMKVQEKIFLGCYIRPFMELLEGEEIDAIKNFNLFEHKDEYFQKARKAINRFKPEFKEWYHLIIAYFMFKNNDINLSNDEKEIAQNVHDNGITSEWIEILKEFFKE